MGKTTFEQDIEKIEEIAAQLEEGDLGLDEGIEKFRHGMDLVRKCQSYLEETELSIRKVVEDRDGAARVEEM